MEEDKKIQAFRIGAVVLGLLAVLTVGEYLIGSIASVWWAPLLGIAILKAFLIMRDYMHIGRVFAIEEDHE
jgi:cytochrome c oxidase subunit IV